MIEKIEIIHLDLRYEKFRLKSKEIERALFASILENDFKNRLKALILKTEQKFFLTVLSDTGVQKNSTSERFPIVHLEVMNPLVSSSLSVL